MADNIEMTLRPIEVKPDNIPPVDLNAIYDDLSVDQKAIVNKVKKEADRQGVDADLMLSIAHIENRFNTGASPKGALGPMQLMPGTAKDLNVDPNDIDQNIAGGVTYYKQMLDKYKSPEIAAIAYNAGPGVADKFLETDDTSVIPLETRNYIKQLSTLYKPKTDDLDVGDLPEITTIPTTPAEEDNDLRNKAIAGTITGAIAAKANEGTRQKMIDVEAEQSTPKERAAAKKRITNADIALKDTINEQVPGRIKNQQALVQDAEKRMASWDKAFTKAQDRLAVAEEFARKAGVIEDFNAPDSKLAQDKDFKIRHGKIDDVGASSRAKQTGYNEGTHYYSEASKEQQQTIDALKRRGIVSAENPVVKFGPATSTPSGILVKQNDAGIKLTPAQQDAKKYLETAQRDYRQAKIDLSKAKSAHAKESSKLANLSTSTDNLVSNAEKNLRIAKKQYENVASKRMPGMVTRIGQQVGKSLFGSVIPGAAAGVDLEDARQRYNRGDIPGAVISGIGGVGGAMSMVPPIPPIGTAVRVIGGLTSLAAPFINYYRDATATEDEQAAATAKYAGGGAVKKFERGGANDVDTVKAPPSDLGDEVLRWSADKIDLARKYLNEAPIPNPFKLLSGDVSMMDSVGDMYFGDTAGLLDRWSKGKAPITFPAYGPKLVNAKFDPAIIDAIGAAFPIVSAAKAGIPLVKSGSKKLFNELAAQYETGTGLGKYMVEPRMNIVEKDKGQAVRKASEKNKDSIKASEALAIGEGKPIYATQTDRTIVSPDEGLLGGGGFPGLQQTSEAHKQAGSVWGVGNAPTAKTIVNSVANDPNAIVTTFIGDPYQHRSNAAVFNKIITSFMAEAKKGRLAPEVR
jgi:hypothetical protein